MTIPVFVMLALLLYAAARRWGVDTRASRQWEWAPRDAGNLVGGRRR
ncbi:MAG: hypothetical protein ABJA16_09330 [Nakamurella sp.]